MGTRAALQVPRFRLFQVFWCFCFTGGCGSISAFFTQYIAGTSSSHLKRPRNICVVKSHCQDARALWCFRGASEHLKLGQFRNTNILHGSTAHLSNVPRQRLYGLRLGRSLLCKPRRSHYSDVVSVELQALVSCVVSEILMGPQRPLSCSKSN